MNILRKPAVRSTVQQIETSEFWDAMEGYEKRWEKDSTSSILLVGGSKSENADLAEKLKESGMECETAENGAVAINLNRSQDFSVVAIRRSLPDVNAEDLGKLIHAHNSRQVEILVLEEENPEIAKEKLMQARTESLRKSRDNRLYGDAVGGAVFEEISHLRANPKRISDRVEAKDSQSILKLEVDKLSSMDSEITRDRQTLKRFFAKNLSGGNKEAPEKLIERAIETIRKINH